MIALHEPDAPRRRGEGDSEYLASCMLLFHSRFNAGSVRASTHRTTVTNLQQGTEMNRARPLPILLPFRVAVFGCTLKHFTVMVSVRL